MEAARSLPTDSAQNYQESASVEAGEVIEPAEDIAAIPSFKETAQNIVSEGLTQTALCRRFGISSSNIGKFAAKAGLSVQDYLKRETGWQHDPTARIGNSKSGLWFPQIES